MVYFIQGEKTGRIKIGKATNVEWRLRNLQPHSPDRLTVLKVLKTAFNDTPYHAQFVAGWSHGEWFDPTPELMAFIESIPVSEYDGLCVQIGNPAATAASGSRHPEFESESIDGAPARDICGQFMKGRTRPVASDTNVQRVTKRLNHQPVGDGFRDVGGRFRKESQVLEN